MEENVPMGRMTEMEEMLSGEGGVTAAQLDWQAAPEVTRGYLVQENTPEWELLGERVMADGRECGPHSRRTGSMVLQGSIRMTPCIQGIWLICGCTR